MKFTMGLVSVLFGLSVSAPAFASTLHWQNIAPATCTGFSTGTAASISAVAYSYAWMSGPVGSTASTTVYYCRVMVPQGATLVHVALYGYGSSASASFYQNLFNSNTTLPLATAVLNGNWSYVSAASALISASPVDNENYNYVVAIASGGGTSSRVTNIEIEYTTP